VENQQSPPKNNNELDHRGPPALSEGDIILAIDFGEKRLGLAIYQFKRDPYPLPYGRILVKNSEQLWGELAKLITAEDPKLLLLGIPRLTDGKETEMTKKIKNFGQELKQRHPSKLYWEQDETLSSFEAEDRMKKSARYNFKIDRDQLDALAASIILEDFLKTHFGMHFTL